jgi:hypothetical protein
LALSWAGSLCFFAYSRNEERGSGMSYTLNARERRALADATLGDPDFIIEGNFPSGVGKGTLDKLVELGLFQTGPSKRYHGEIGWRMTDDGWRCMYGKTHSEMMASCVRHHPLPIWSWPLTNELTAKK